MERFTRLLRKTFVVGLTLIVLALCGGAVYQAIASRLDMMHNPAPGKLVDVGGFRLHINCTGQGEPAVIFDSGLADNSITWHKVQSQVAMFTKACSYDRAGLGGVIRVRIQGPVRQSRESSIFY